MSLLLTSALLLAAGSAVAQGSSVSVDPFATYLRIDTAVDSAGNTVPIALAALGVSAGDTIVLKRVGDYVGISAGADDQTAMVGVFSASSVLLAQTNLNRVQDAIDAGTDFVTGATFPNNLPTDIAEDFFVTGGGIQIQVPTGATHLFVAVPDNLYGDNQDPDGDFAVEICCGVGPPVPVPGLTAWGIALAAALLVGTGFRASWRRVAARARGAR